MFRISGRPWLLCFSMWLAGLTMAPAPAVAQQLKPISVIVFPGGFNWPIWVAQEKGLFDRNGIVVAPGHERRHPFLQDRLAQLIQPHRLRARPRPIRELGESPTTPKRKSPIEPRDRYAELPPIHCPSPLRDKPVD